MTIPQERRLDKVKIETQKGNKLLPNIPTGNIIELDYASATLVCNKIGIPQRN